MSLKPGKVRSVHFLINKMSKQHPELKIPYTGLFLGAGCSVYAGIPLASGIINMCKRKAYIMDIEGGSKVSEDQEEKFINDRLDAFNTWTTDKENQLKTYIKETNPTLNDETLENKYWDNLYSHWFMQFSENDKERHRLIEGVIEKAEPKGPYIFLAYLIERGVFKNIFTTNFDDLVNDAISYYTAAKPRMYHSDDMSRYISFTSNKPNIIKLHGDFRFSNIKNTIKETDHLDVNYSSKLKDYLSRLDLLIIGYNGADKSIMDVLEKAKEERAYGLYWCVRKLDEVHPRVKKLINETDNSYLFEIGDFSSLVVQLHNQFGELRSREKSIIKIAEERLRRQQDFELTFRTQLDTTDISDAEKKKFDETIDFNKLFDKAYKMSDDQSNEMIEIYNQVIEMNPNYWQAYYNRGLAKNINNDHKEAIKDFDKAIEIAPDVSNNYVARGRCYDQLGNQDMAIADYTLGIEKDKKNAIGYYNRGTSKSKKSDLDSNPSLEKDAIKDYTKAIELDADYVNSYIGRGYSKISLKLYEESIYDFNMALKLDPVSILALNNRAHSNLKLENYDLSIEDYSEMINIDPSNSEAYSARSLAKTSLKDYNEAMIDIDKAIELNPKNGFAHGVKARLYGYLKEVDLFYEWLEKALELGYAISNYIDDEPVYKTYRDQKRFKDLLKKYKIVLADKDAVA